MMDVDEYCHGWQAELRSKETQEQNQVIFDSKVNLVQQ